MKVNSRKQTEINVRLNEDEAKWLKSFIQNYHGDPANETSSESEMRRELFESLQRELGK